MSTKQSTQGYAPVSGYSREAMLDVEKKLSVLEEVAKIVKQFQKLTYTLENLVYASSAENPLVEKSFEVLEGMDQDHASMPTEKIEFRLDNLENKIKDDLVYFIDLVNVKLANTVDDTTESILPERHIEEFRRRVKLALAYRVVLTERGEDLLPFEADVSLEDMTRGLATLRVQEKIHRVQFVNKMEELQQDLKGYISDNKLGSELRELFADMLQGLIANIAHVNAGHSVETIPMPVEDIDVAAAMAMSCSSDNQEAQVLDASVPASTANKTETKKGGFFNRLGEWLDSPMEVTWADVKDQEKGSKQKKK